VPESFLRRFEMFQKIFTEEPGRKIVILFLLDEV